MTQGVAYYRVSTQQQGRSGLGIEAQKAAIARFAEAEGIEVVGEHVEVETGKGTTRSIADRNSPRRWRELAKRNARLSWQSSIACPVTSPSSAV